MNEANASGFCVNCGQPLIAGARFCVGCGTERTSSAQETAPVVPPEPAPAPAPAPAPIPPPPAPAAAPVVQPAPAPIPPPPAPVAAPVVQPAPAPPPPPAPVTAALPITAAPVAASSSSSRNRAILIGLVIGLVIVGVIFAIWKLSSGSKSASSTTTIPVPTVAPTAPPTVAPAAVAPVTPPATLPTPAVTQQAADEAGALNGMLLASVSKRSAINPAVTYIGGCSAIDAGKQAFTDALASRQALLLQLGGQSLAFLPQGAALKSTLTQAWQSSIQADTSYIAWATALEASPPCDASTSYQDQNYLDAHADDAVSTSYKRQFVMLWNQIAPTYGFQQQTDGSI